MSRRKLIELFQEDLIVCDNKQCSYKIPNPTGDPNTDSSIYINAPCPKCGENLLTEKDYLLDRKIMKTINWINRWFGWLAYILPKDKNPKHFSIRAKDGIKFQQEEDDKFPKK